MVIPGAIQYCRIDLKLMRAEGDGSDPDRHPDGVPLEGATVTLTPSVQTAKIVTTEPPVTIAMSPISGTTDSDGRLVSGDGVVGLFVVASDAEDLTPNGFTYLVSVRHPSITIPAFSIFASAGEEIDLTTVIPVSSSQGSGVAEWLVVKGEIETATQEAIDAVREEFTSLVQGAESARDQAETFAANTVALQDTAIADRIADENSAARAQLNATIALGQSVVVTNPEGLTRHRTFLGRALFERERVLALGDSITAGAYANDAADTSDAAKIMWGERGWVGQLRRLFSAVYGDSGEGFVGFGSDEGRWTYTGTSSGTTLGPGRPGRQFSAGATASADNVGPFDEVAMHGYYISNLGAASLFIDGTDKTPTLLTDAQHALEVSATAWGNRGNTFLAHETESGENILAATSGAAGNMSFQTPISAGNTHPCTPGDRFLVGAEIKSVAASREWRAGLLFFDAAGAQVSELTTLDATASTVGVWQAKSYLVTAPANAAYAAAIIRIDGATAGSEEHKIRRVRAVPVATIVGQSGATLWTAYRAVTEGVHDVEIRGAATGNVFLAGIELNRGNAGVQVSRAGRSGATSRDVTGGDLSSGTKENLLLSTIELMRPDLTIVALGANDVAKQVEQSLTPSVYRANLKTITDRTAAQGGCSLLIAGPRYNNETSPITQDEFYAAAKDLAASDPHVAFVDIGRGQWVSHGLADSAGFMWDSIHPTMAGHGDYARAVFEALTSRSLGRIAA